MNTDKTPIPAAPSPLDRNAASMSRKHKQAAVQRWLKREQYSAPSPTRWFHW